MGSGHIMRCLALASAARQAGATVVMGGCCTIPWLRGRLEGEAYLFREEPCPPQAEAVCLLDQLDAMARRIPRPTCDCAVILDGYHFTPACQSAVRERARALLVIDDYQHLPRYDCDILLNPNPGSEVYAYEGAIGLKLLGPDYALLRPEFKTPPSSGGHPKGLLLSLGGGDFSGFLPSLASALRIPSMRGKILRVIAGSTPIKALHTFLGQGPFHLEIWPGVDDMPSLLADTDLCISAGGSTCWELCRMGVPFLTVEVAENQRRICDWLDAHGYAPRFSAPVLTALLDNAQLRAERAPALRNLVDGRGAERAVNALLRFVI